MTDEQLSINFYKGNAVHDVLKRFEFSDEEKSVINAAIRTSRSKTPSIKLIQKADILLKDIAKNRQPIVSNTKTPVSPEALAKIEAMSIKQKRHNFTKATRENRNSNYLKLDSKVMTTIWITVLVAFIIYNTFYKKETIVYSPVTFQKAQEQCKKQNRVLPVTYFDLDREMRQPSFKNETGYWTADRKIAYNIARPFGQDDGQKHYVKCVKVSGMEYQTILRQ